MQPIPPSPRLAEVRYAIRGALARRARALEAAGREIVHLNIGNPGRFGFPAPAHLVAAVRAHLPQSVPYSEEQGLAAARDAVVAQQHARGSTAVDAAHVFLGNGVSELIDMSLRALLAPGDEVLLPSPDYPLWSAVTTLNGGRPRYYACRRENAHLPDPDELARLVTPKTRAIVLINPNNPTGAVYPRALLERIVALAAKHDLILMADEIYDGITYDGAEFQPLAPLAGKVPCLSFGGLSKVHRACGWRAGWVSLSGDRAAIAPWREALQLLAALRLCPNVPGQYATIAALTGPDTISALTAPGGRLHEARRAVLEGVAASRFLEVVAPRGAIYAFPSVRADVLPAFDDNAFALRLLEEESVLVTPGSGFNVPGSRHLRLTLLPEPAAIADVFARIERVLERLAAAPQRAIA